VGYLGRAAAKAAGRGAYRETLNCLEQALGALSHLPESRETLEQAVDLHLNLRNALLAVGEFERMLEHLREAETIARALGDPRRLGRVSSFITNYYFSRGDHERAIESGQRDLEFAVALGDLALEVVANYYLGQAYHARGEYRRAIDFLERTVAALTGDLVHERFGQGSHPSVSSRSWLVRSLTELGEFTEGTILGEEAVRIAEATDHHGSRVPAYLGLGLLHLRRGSLHQAIPVLEHGLEVCRVADIPVAVPMFGSFLSHAYALAGRGAEAIPLAEQAEAQIAGMRAPVIYTAHAPSLSEAYLLADRMNDATRIARRAIDLSREHGEPGNEAWALRLLGEIHSRSNPPDVEKAENRYREALALAEELKMRPLLAHCHMGLGRLYGRSGKRQEAEEHLTAAASLFRDMDMTFWLTRAQGGMGA
jgi:tetratricopeptide (TPR) repeat protein